MAVGLQNGSNGNYSLSGGTLTANGHEFIGDLGTGTFTQTGGTNAVGSGSFLIVGAVSGSIGTYSLSDTGILTANGEEYIGDEGAGTFNQSGGTHTINGGQNLNLGYVNGSLGTYNLTAGNVNVGDSVYVGGSNSGAGGTGVFNVSGNGSLAIGGTLVIYDVPGNGVSFSNGTIAASALNFNENRRGSIGPAALCRSPTVLFGIQQLPPHRLPPPLVLRSPWALAKPSPLSAAKRAWAEWRLLATSEQ